MVWEPPLRVEGEFSIGTLGYYGSVEGGYIFPWSVCYTCRFGLTDLLELVGFFKDRYLWCYSVYHKNL